MGHRSQFVIVREGDQQHYYDQWAGLLAHRDLLWGPESSERWIRAMSPMEPGEWMDAGDAEGGALVDFDQKRLIWFGVEESLSVPKLRELHQRLLGASWKGFQVQHANRGLIDIAQAVGAADDVETFDEDYRIESLDDAAFEADEDDPEPDDENDEELEYEDDDEDEVEEEEPGAWVSLRQDGRWRHRRLIALPRELLTGGPDVLPRIAELPPAEVPPELEVQEAMWIDAIDKQIGLWGGPETRRWLDRVREAWPGWSVSWAGDGYAEQIQICEAEGQPLSDAEALGRLAPEIISTQTFDLSTVFGAIGGGVTGCAVRAAVGLTVAILALLGLIGLLVGNWTTLGIVAAVFVGAIVLATLAIVLLIRRKVRQFSLGGPKPAPVPGPSDENERRARLDALLASAGLPALQKIEPHFNAEGTVAALE